MTRVDMEYSANERGKRDKEVKFAIASKRGGGEGREREMEADRSKDGRGEEREEEGEAAPAAFSLAFGVARREGHCQCQGGSRQPSFSRSRESEQIFLSSSPRIWRVSSVGFRSFLSLFLPIVSLAPILHFRERSPARASEWRLVVESAGTGLRSFPLGYVRVTCVRAKKN